MRKNLVVLMLAGAATQSTVALAADAPLIQDAQLQDAGLYNFWEAHLPLASGDTLLTGYLVDEALYVVTDHGTVFSLTANEGLIRWGTKFAADDYHVHPPTHIQTADDHGPVVIVSPAEVSLFDRFTGRRLRSFVPSFGPSSGAVGFDNNVLMGGSDGRFHSLMVFSDSCIPPFEQWEVLSAGSVTARPILFDGAMVLFASRKGRVFVCRADDKSLDWSSAVGGPIVGDPALDAQGVYVSSMNRSLYKLDRDSGQQLWRVRFPRPLPEGPVVVADTVYQHCSTVGLVALDAVTGEEKWHLADGLALAAHNQAGDIVFGKGHRLLVVDPTAGSVRNTIEAPSAVGTVANTRDGAAYVLGRDGQVTCVRLDTVPYLRRQQVIAARRQLNRPPATSADVINASSIAENGNAGESDKDPFKSRNDHP